MCGPGSCAPGFLDCDKNPANGCEIDGSKDAANCGKSIDNGIVINMNGNSEDCANGMIANCIAGQCTEGVTYHAIECQCGP